jgi:hypothetical protein
VRVRLAAAAALAALVGTARAASSADAFGGYSYLRRDGDSLHGGALSLTLPLRGAVRLTVEITNHQGLLGGSDLSEQAFLIGPTFMPRRDGRVRPFVHAKAGLVRLQSQVGVFGVAIGEEGVCEGSCPGDIGFAAEAGGGLDWRVRDRWLLRLPQVDYRLARQEGDTVSSLRASAGVVFRWGR